MEVAQMPSLDYQVHPLSGLKIRAHRADMSSRRGREDCEINLRDNWYKTTGRFWESTFAWFGFSSSVFRYFGHQEVFDRIQSMRNDVEMRFCIDKERKSLLAVSNPKKEVLQVNSFLQVAKEHRGMRSSYANGVLSCSFRPQSGERPVQIGGDDFQNEYVMLAPIDGYGNPSIYLSLLRIICENGNVALAPAFRSDVPKSKEPIQNIARQLETFDSDEGYSALRHRFAASQTTQASLRECLGLYRRVKPLGNEPMKLFEKVVGDIYGVYGVANIEGISEKRQRLLPAKCRVYDLLNLASELSTHHAEEKHKRLLGGWLGSSVAQEFDLEGMEMKPSDFPALFGEKKKPKKLSS